MAGGGARRSGRYSLRQQPARKSAESEGDGSMRQVTTRRTVMKVYESARGVRTEHEEKEVVVEERELGLQRSSKRQRKTTHRYSPGEDRRTGNYARQRELGLRERHQRPTSEESGDFGDAAASEPTRLQSETEDGEISNIHSSRRRRPSLCKSVVPRELKRRRSGSDYSLRPRKRTTKYFEGKNAGSKDEKYDYLDVEEGVDCDDCEIPDVDIVPDTVGLNAIKSIPSLPGAETGSKHVSKMPLLGKGSGCSLDVAPMQVDPSLNFDDVGGMDDCIRQLKEIAFLPLIYPELFQQFNITPPRGILFHGAPGTGKTLMAKVLAAEASRGGRKVTFFMRKGADVLTKWVGESERALRALFEEAKKCQPAIIFFDEIDGLAPARSGRMDHVHNSLVATLLALMDGLESRGEVIVIGATNRLDAIDDALKRPGRFDRMYKFNLPDATAREKILVINTRRWETPPAPGIVKELVELTTGYCGADLKAVCTEAFFVAVRRTFPQVYETRQKLLLADKMVQVSREDFLAAISIVAPSATTACANFVRPMSSLLAPCLSKHVLNILHKIQAIFPAAGQCLSNGIATPAGAYAVDGKDIARSACLKAPASLLICGRMGCMQHVVGSAVLHQLEHLPVMSLGITDLLTSGATILEEALLNTIKEACRCAPAILYLPDFHIWCRSASQSLKSILEATCKFHLSAPVLVLAVAEGPAAKLKPSFTRFVGEVPQYVGACQPQVHEVGLPSECQREEFFKSSVLEAAKPPRSLPAKVPTPHPELPVDTLALKRDAEVAKKEGQRAVREMRMCLREVTNTLMTDASYCTFIEPDELLEDMQAWETSEVPQGFYRLLENVNNNRYSNPQAYVKDVEGLVHLTLQRVKEKQGHAEMLKSKDLGQRLKDAAALMVESRVSPSLISKCNSLVPKHTTQLEDGYCRTGDSAQGDEAALCGVVEDTTQEEPVPHNRMSSRLAGAAVDMDIVHQDPEVAMRKLRNLARDKAQDDPPLGRAYNGKAFHVHRPSDRHREPTLLEPLIQSRSRHGENETSDVSPGDVAQQLARASEGLSLDQMLLLHSRIAQKVASCQRTADRGAVLHDILEEGLKFTHMGGDWMCLDAH
eukprot:evm.model.scf_342.2 EVM.evm.TU.scf_342.2   scf_342:46006-59666(+)